MKYLFLLLLIGLGVRQATAACILLWDVPRDVPLEGFRITITDLVAQKLDQLDVTPSAVGACGKEPADTYCAQLPVSPPPGVYGIFVQAKRGGQMTEEAAARQQGLLCHIIAGRPCQCMPLAGPTTPTLPQAAPSRTPVLPAPVTIPPDAQALLNTVPATAPGTALAGPELLQQAQQVSAPAITPAVPT